MDGSQPGKGIGAQVIGDSGADVEVLAIRELEREALEQQGMMRLRPMPRATSHRRRRLQGVSAELSVRPQKLWNQFVTDVPNSPPTTLPTNHTAAARIATQMANLTSVDTCTPCPGALCSG
jgi:hypothetical protein